MIELDDCVESCIEIIAEKTDDEWRHSYWHVCDLKKRSMNLFSPLCSLINLIHDVRGVFNIFHKPIPVAGYLNFVLIHNARGNHHFFIH